MSNLTKQSRIGTILHEKELYMENNKQSPKYISIDEYNFKMMMIKEYNDSQIKQNTETNIFHAFFYIPIRIYNCALYTSSKISYI